MPEINNDGFIEIIKNLDTWQIFTIVLIVVLLYFIIKSELIDKLLKSKKENKKLEIESEKIESQTKLEIEIKRIKDEFLQKAFKSIEAAAHHAVESLEHCIGANYYVIHDSGNDLKNVDDWYLAVLRSTSFAVGTDYEKPVLIGNGFRWLNEQARDKVFFYVPDTFNEENLSGIEGDYLKAMDIKSCAICLVKNEKSVYHFVSLNFDMVQPKKLNTNLRKVLFEFKRTVMLNI